MFALPGPYAVTYATAGVVYGIGASVEEAIRDAAEGEPDFLRYFDPEVEETEGVFSEMSPRPDFSNVEIEPCTPAFVAHVEEWGGANLKWSYVGGRICTVDEAEAAEEEAYVS